MFGILKLAYKLLVNDKAKFTALLIGSTFAVFLMTEITAMLRRSESRIQAVSGPLDPLPPRHSLTPACEEPRSGSTKRNTTRNRGELPADCSYSVWPG